MGVRLLRLPVDLLGVGELVSAVESTEAQAEMLDMLATTVRVTVTYGRCGRTVTVMGFGPTVDDAAAVARTIAARAGVDDGWDELCVSTPRSILESLRGGS